MSATQTATQTAADAAAESLAFAEMAEMVDADLQSAMARQPNIEGPYLG